MARQMVSDGDDVFRLRVEWHSGTVQFFGPFNSIGAARGQRTVHAKGSLVKKAEIQSAYVVWRDVQ